MTQIAHASEIRRDASVRFTALRRQHSALEEELRAAFERVLRSGNFVLGEEVERFEAEFARYCEASYCVGVSSGTEALALALRASGIGPGDEVIVPAHTFIASALAVAHVGAAPVLCDVEDDTGLIDAEAARAMVGSRTAAIVPVHLYGQPCDMATIEALARRHGLLVLEDAAHAHGARYRGRRVGSLGTAAAFSFYPGKNLGALGDGGAICTNDAMLATRLRRLRNVGQRRKGEHVDLGYNARLDELQAAMLRAKLVHLDDWNAARRESAGHYRELLSEVVRTLEERSDRDCVFHVYPVRLRARDEVAAALKRHGIETGVHYTPAVHQHAAWSVNSLAVGDVPRAEEWSAEELSLPMHPDLDIEEIGRVADAVDAAISSHRFVLGRC
jgi:dTDP-4-amino-4,6-dideoxygalactose transaminase